jgi:hypothetical protein
VNCSLRKKFPPSAQKTFRNNTHAAGVYAGMFEQSVLSDVAARRTSLFLFVTSAQVAAIAIGVMAPLFWIVLPPVAQLPKPIRWVPAHIDLAPVPEDVAAPRPISRRVLYLPLVAPIRIPNGILREVPAAPPDLAEFGEPGPAAPDGVFGATGVMNPAVPPPAPIHKEAPIELNPVHVSQGVQEAKLIRRILPFIRRSRFVPGNSARCGWKRSSRKTGTSATSACLAARCSSHQLPSKPSGNGSTNRHC